MGGAGFPPLVLRGVADPQNHAPPSPHMCYYAEFSRSGSNGTSVRTEISRKDWALASRLSKSLDRPSKRLRLPISDR